MTDASARADFAGSAGEQTLPSSHRWGPYAIVGVLS